MTIASCWTSPPPKRFSYPKLPMRDMDAWLRLKWMTRRWELGPASPQEWKVRPSWLRRQKPKRDEWRPKCKSLGRIDLGLSRFRNVPEPDGGGMNMGAGDCSRRG
jgi:hypothetical protein